MKKAGLASANRKPQTANRERDPRFAARAKGMAAYVAMVNPRQGDKLAELRAMKA
ncbi:MAG: hypothetical protein K8T20_13225 [Planctomycetes bacterium]|nr:hypothetical protein [Planctomycetota bacterium]